MSGVPHDAGPDTRWGGTLSNWRLFVRTKPARGTGSPLRRSGLAWRQGPHATRFERTGSERLTPSGGPHSQHRPLHETDSDNQPTIEEPQPHRPRCLVTGRVLGNAGAVETTTRRDSSGRPRDSSNQRSPIRQKSGRTPRYPAVRVTTLSRASTGRHSGGRRTWHGTRKGSTRSRGHLDARLRILTRTLEARFKGKLRISVVRGNGKSFFFTFLASPNLRTLDNVRANGLFPPHAQRESLYRERRFVRWTLAHSSAPLATTNRTPLNCCKPIRKSDCACEKHLRVLGSAIASEGLRISSQGFRFVTGREGIAGAGRAR